MGMWERFTSRLRAAVRRDEPLRYFTWLWPDQPAGITITSDTALQISVVWACVDAIASSIASCPWNIYALKGRNRELLPDDPLDYLLNTRPNSEMTAITLREVMLFGALTWGNGYAEIQRTASGKVAALWPLLPNRMLPRRNRETGELFYEYQQDDGGIATLGSQDVFHLKGPGISGLMGDNIVARAAKSISLAAAQERFASTYFGNNTLLGGVLKSKKKLSPDTHKMLKDDFADKYQGAAKSNSFVILEEDMDFVATSNDADKAQLVPSRQYQIEDICRWYKVPPHKVQHLLRSTNNNIEHQGLEFSRDALTPWARRIEQEADFKCFSSRGPWRRTKLDMAWLSQGDFKSRFEGYQIGRRIGVYNINEIREKEGENHIGPDGDIRIVEANMQTLEQLEVGGPQAFAALNAPEAEVEAGAEGADAGASGDAGSGSTAEPSQPVDMVRLAMVELFAGSLERYARRLANREADLRRGGASDAKVSTHMNEARADGRVWFAQQSVAAVDVAVKASGASRLVVETAALLALDRVDNGQDPKASAELLVATLMEGKC